jgi:hypothetical protein
MFPCTPFFSGISLVQLTLCWCFTFITCIEYLWKGTDIFRLESLGEACIWPDKYWISSKIQEYVKNNSGVHITGWERSTTYFGGIYSSMNSSTLFLLVTCIWSISQSRFIESFTKTKNNSTFQRVKSGVYLSASKAVKRGRTSIYRNLSIIEQVPSSNNYKYCILSPKAP